MARWRTVFEDRFPTKRVISRSSAVRPAFIGHRCRSERRKTIFVLGADPPRSRRLQPFEVFDELPLSMSALPASSAWWSCSADSQDKSGDQRLRFAPIADGRLVDGHARARQSPRAAPSGRATRLTKRFAQASSSVWSTRADEQCHRRWKARRHSADRLARTSLVTEDETPCGRPGGEHPAERLR